MSDVELRTKDDRAAKAEQVLSIVEKFVIDQRITCAETVCQSDRVIENAYDLMVDLCEVAGYLPENDE